MKSVAAIRHVHFEGLGAFRTVLELRGYRIEYVDAGIDDLDAFDPISPDLLVVLGAPIGAYEEERYPFLASELRLIAERLASGRPLLGVCLGAQLIARALGAGVRPGPGKEIGWGPVTLTDAAQTGLLRHIGSVPVLHWHGDIFDLPEGAERLASTAPCPNQAFVRGPSVLAFQFHPEAEVAGFERWLVGHAVEISVAGLSPEILRRETAKYAPAAAERGRLVLADWLAGLE